MFLKKRFYLNLKLIFQHNFRGLGNHFYKKRKKEKMLVNVFKEEILSQPETYFPAWFQRFRELFL